jgi:hypothetical protein
MLVAESKVEMSQPGECENETRGSRQGRQNIKNLLEGVGRYTLYRLLRVYTDTRYRRILILSTRRRK